MGNGFGAQAADSLLADVNEATSASLVEELGGLWIQTKDKREVPFRVNRVQRDIAERAFEPRIGPTKLLVLKARQLGVSTFVQGWAYVLTSHQKLTNAVTISHQADATQRLHSKQKFFLKHDPVTPRTAYNRVGALIFSSTGSSHYVETAGAKASGRGDTLHFAHCSELAFWPDAETILTGLTQALTADGVCVVESTPNGMGGYFYELWQGAPDNGWTPLFYPWWWEDEYRLEVEPDQVLPYRDDEAELVTEQGLDHRQIAWRRMKQLELRGKFPQEYPENAIECFLVSGQPYFSSEGLDAQVDNIRIPLSDRDGLAVWAEYDPLHSYVIAADPAEGLEGGDFSVGQVLDITTGEQVARLRGHWPTDHFGRLLGQLGVRYGMATIAPERNNHGHAVINTLRNEVRYPNLYRHREYTPIMSTDERHRFGWPTTTTTKPVMLSELDAALIEDGIKIRDSLTLGELRTMHWDGKGGVSAVEGTHDDAAMSIAIAWQVRKLRGARAWVLEQRATIDTKAAGDPVLTPGDPPSGEGTAVPALPAPSTRTCGFNGCGGPNAVPARVGGKPVDLCAQHLAELTKIGMAVKAE